MSTNSFHQMVLTLLPSHICAASSFRHTFIWTGLVETSLTLTNCCLDGLLSVSTFTTSFPVQTSFHPYWQASIFFISFVSYLIKLIALIGFGTAVIINDGEIFCASAQEEAYEQSRNMNSKIGSKNNNWHGKTKLNRRNISISGLSAFAPFSLKEKQKIRSRSAADPRSSKAQKQSNRKPEVVARKCFVRRQGCLNKLLHSLAAYPVIQLITGSASVSFWFSGNNVQMPAFKLSHITVSPQQIFNCHIALGTLDLLHTVLFLLVATWHYARVDWKMQTLAANRILSTKTVNDTTKRPCPWKRQGHRSSRKYHSSRDPHLKRALFPTLLCNTLGERPHSNHRGKQTDEDEHLTDFCTRHRAMIKLSSLDIPPRQIPFSVPVSPTSTSFNHEVHSDRIDLFPKSLEIQDGHGYGKIIIDIESYPESTPIENHGIQRDGQSLLEEMLSHNHIKSKRALHRTWSLPL